MNTSKYTRRRFLQTSSAATAAGLVTPYFLSAAAADDLPRSKNDRHVIGCIGTGSRWGQIVGAAMNYGDVVAVCDVDRNHAEKAREKVGGKAKIHEDYRKLLDDKSIDTVLIVTPDHWHTKPCIDAMRAGKDIYCEKPLTLTIDEGKKIIKVLDQTQRVFQVGTQQRTEMNGRFITAVALARSGRLGKIQKITCAIGAAPTGGPFPVEPVPEGLHWDMWLGQAPLVEYRRRRCHYEFRWWYEYSGGKMTDWGAHHVDIAHWALGADDTGPISVEGTATHPVPLKGGYPTADDSYNTATEFFISCKFADGAEVVIRHDTENGVTIQGEKGEIFVSRGALRGAAVDELKDNPLPDDLLAKLLKGQKPGSHMANFFACLKTREQPISDVYSHHRAMTTCHLANIAIRLGRKLQWDPRAEQIIGDSEANTWQAREQRRGYEIEA